MDLGKLKLPAKLAEKLVCLLRDPTIAISMTLLVQNGLAPNQAAPVLARFAKEEQVAWLVLALMAVGLGQVLEVVAEDAAQDGPGEARLQPR